MNRLLFLAIAAAVLLALIVDAMLIVDTGRQPEPAATAPGGAPVGRFVAIDDAEFSAVQPVDPKGQKADMSAYRGKALLVNLWATWCAPCIEELPSLGKLQEALGGDDFAVVTIAIDERDPARIAPFLAEHGAGNLPALIDLNRTVDKVARIAALPTSLLVGRDGKVKAMMTGDTRWHCGKPLEAVKAFIADGTVSQNTLEPCE